MILKRWFAWTCLILVLVAEVALFRAYRQKDALQTELQSTKAELWRTQDKLAELQKTDVGLEAAEISRLGKINQILTNKVNELTTAIMPLWQASQSNAQSLATARQAIRLQQAHLQQLESENNQIVDASTAVIAQKTCLNNLRLIDDAKQEWAKANNQPDSAIPVAKDLLPYLKDNIFPSCPDGGKYSINAVNEAPTCSIPTHNYPAEPAQPQPAATH